ncbi:MAG TPA: hypothetical protein VMS43_17520 [Allosphingosinicella sp.]|nr:hypothetical protein [Allosphingosinicella sp.]
MKKSAILAAALLLLPACAGEHQLRSVSSQSAAILGQYRTQLVRFSTAQNQLNAANAARLRAYEGERQFRLSEIQSRTMAWRLAGERDVVGRFELLTQRDAATILAVTDGASGQPAPAEPLRFDAAPVEAVIRQLTALQRPRGLVDYARDTFRFATALRAKYEESLSGATSTTTASAGASAAATPN